MFISQPLTCWAFCPLGTSYILRSWAVNSILNLEELSDVSLLAIEILQSGHKVWPDLALRDMSGACLGGVMLGVFKASVSFRT